MTIFAAMADTLFADPHLASDAIYTPPPAPGGETVAVRLMTRTPDANAGLGAAGFRFSVEEQGIALVADLRRSDVATPHKGGTLTIGERHYQIAAEPELDPAGLIWSLNLRAMELP